MKPYIVDYDEHLQEYIEQWIMDNSDGFEDPDEMELALSEIYEEWLEIPADWLDKKTPNNYFSQFDDGEMLIKLMLRYLSKKVGMPSPLLDRIVELKDTAADALKDIFTLSTVLPANIDVVETRILVLNLLIEIDDEGLFEYYAQLLSEASLDSGLVDSIIDVLAEADKSYTDMLLDMLNECEDDIVSARYVDILVNFPGNDEIFKHLLRRLEKDSDHIALMASYLGKYGDIRAIPYLREALEFDDINYLDYLEVKNAIEELGEDIEDIKEFNGDNYYESLKCRTD